MEYWNEGMLSKTAKTFILFPISTHSIGKNYVLKFNRDRRWSRFFVKYPKEIKYIWIKKYTTAFHQFIPNSNLLLEHIHLI